MYAIRLHEFGGPEQLSYEQVPDPMPGHGQLRIAVRAAGVRGADLAFRAGTLDCPAAEFPLVPGQEVAGVVDALGAGVPPWLLGRRVVTHLGLATGGYAELVIREAAAVHPIPQGLSSAAAVAMIETGRSALSALNAAALSATDVVAVTAAAGALGSMLVRGARASGAKVIAIVDGPVKPSAIRGLGASFVLEHTAADWPAELSGAVTAVLDSAGGEQGARAFDLLAPGGRFVMCGAGPEGPAELSTRAVFARGLTVCTVPCSGTGIRTAEARALATAVTGGLVPAVQSFPLSAAAEAHDALATRASFGKVVLRPSVPAGQFE
ncbi:NADPH2:quinone reductase [Tamaricihabitans halophyticus]|uniref:NADPH2:quinone reductase n=1 Tax=Tamaricihabitans halophyticus TaxID=1262583 RepID=A0A4R2R4V5_9PSEU|nr:zinc-binding dehydrogenase [Tamaricihabitans halophyticus]TCP57047.1 NADPH2:quinone reductase [Tamaricihabitans halophyticus]